MSFTESKAANAWRQIAHMVNFDEQPICRAADMMALPPVSFSPAPIEAAIDFKFWEFRRAPVFDRRRREWVGSVVMARHSDGGDWEPLDELPNYLEIAP